jgi:hypothetical protein
MSARNRGLVPMPTRRTAPPRAAAQVAPLAAMKTWHAFAFLIVTAVALYYLKWPMEWVMEERPQRFRWAPGDYLFKCRDCKHNGGKDRTCIGDKRAIMCADCAYALPDDHEPTDMATDKHAQTVR